MAKGTGEESGFLQAFCIHPHHVSVMPPCLLVQQQQMVFSDVFQSQVQLPHLHLAHLPRGNYKNSNSHRQDGSVLVNRSQQDVAPHTPCGLVRLHLLLGHKGSQPSRDRYDVCTLATLVRRGLKCLRRQTPHLVEEARRWGSTKPRHVLSKSLLAVLSQQLVAYSYHASEAAFRLLSAQETEDLTLSVNPF